MNNKLVVGFVNFLFILSLTACNADQNKTNNIESINEKEFELQNYQGSWIDKDLNLFTSSDCENSLDIYLNDVSKPEGDISLFLYNPDRVTDSVATFQLNGDEASFTFDDSSGKGEGRIFFLNDEIHIRLNLEKEADKKLNDIYSTERIFVRNPYKGLISYDPIELIKDYLHLKNTSELEINDSVEWSEELEAGPEIEVVNRINEAGEVVQMYKVNTLNKSIKELEMW